MRILGVMLSLALLGCAQHVQPEDLLTQIDAGEPPVILDVRSRGEYEAGHVPGARHVPFYSAWGEIEALSEAEGPVVVYCEHGPRAGMAHAGLWISGEGPVVYLEGHMTEWREKGLRMDKAE